jgi:hypothetical protein
MSSFKMLMLVTPLLAMGCESSFTGSVGGESLTIKDSVFMPMKSGDTTVGVVALLSDYPNLCAAFKAGREPKAAKFMSIEISEIIGGQAQAPGTGDFTVDQTAGVDGKHAYGEFRVTDEHCAATRDVGSKSGLVKVSHVEPSDKGLLNAKWDLTFGDDQVKGEIVATFCDFNWHQRTTNCD